MATAYWQIQRSLVKLSISASRSDVFDYYGNLPVGEVSLQIEPRSSIHPVPAAKSRIHTKRKLKFDTKIVRDTRNS